MELKEYFKYTRDQRIALLLLIVLMIVIQLLYSFIDFTLPTKISKEEKEWLALQSEIDSLKNNTPENEYKMYLFNPNYLTDFKGYKLGMSIREIDRLLEYRKSGKFVNSAQEFQEITRVSDELLNKISPYFKFPDWVKNRKYNYESYSKSAHKTYDKGVKKIIVQDINTATKEDFMKIFGIGDAISDRIIKQREVFGGFLSMEQLQDVWGLSPDVLYELNKNFKIGTIPAIAKIDINNASTKELMKLPYFKYGLAREIVTYRSMNGAIKSVEDLIKIKGFPVEKVQIIALYLDFK